MNENPEVIAYLEKQSEQSVLLINKVRSHILNAESGVSESFKYKRINFEYNGIFAFLKPAKDHVSLVFIKGVELETEGYKERLEGTGTKMRHVKISTVEELGDVVIIELIKKAIELNK